MTERMMASQEAFEEFFGGEKSLNLEDFNFEPQNGSDCPKCKFKKCLGYDESHQLYCSVCGYVFQDHIAFEADEVLAGTAVYSRRSQAGDAGKRRYNLALEELERREHVEYDEEPTDEELFYEGVRFFVLELAIVLVKKELAPSSLFSSLKQIINHWIRTRHEAVRKPSWNRAFVLSLLALALLYERVDLLSRDLVAMSLNGDLPYFSLPRKFPESVQTSFDVFTKIAPYLPPTVPIVEKGMIEFGSGDTAWPSLSQFFDGRPGVYCFGESTHVPVGNPDLVLKRLVKHIGLPDSFVDRVHNFSSKRAQAKRALEETKAPKHPRSKKHKGRRDGKRLVEPPDGFFSFHVSKLFDCCEYPTSRTLLVDLVNTIRLCYGNHSRRSLVQAASGDSDAALDLEAQLKEEWGSVVKRVNAWYNSGGGGDVSLSSWYEYSPAVIRKIRGRALDVFCSRTENVHRNMLSEIPPVLRRFADEFYSFSDTPRTASTSPALSTSSTLEDQVQTPTLQDESVQYVPGVHHHMLSCQNSVESDLELIIKMIRCFFLATTPNSYLLNNVTEDKFSQRNLVKCVNSTACMVLDYRKFSASQHSCQVSNARHDP